MVFFALEDVVVFFLAVVDEDALVEPVVDVLEEEALVVEVFAVEDLVDEVFDVVEA